MPVSLRYANLLDRLSRRAADRCGTVCTEYSSVYCSAKGVIAVMSSINNFAGRVSAWEEQVTIPTYGTGQPDKNPMFLEKRVYQGSSGVVYPYPIIDRVSTDRSDKTYHAVFLENRYLKIMLLPELGGRVQMALDKTNGYHFVYYNRVIKPALVGLAGPWISGGIEFNWPQHHRPSTFEPVDHRVEAHADGSWTVWCSEIERMFHTKGMIGFTLYPDAAFLELRVQLYNRTARPQSFLWWANPAVHVNDAYQSVFPPDVHAVMDHGKRAVSDFPIATGTYYKVNYAPGTDISRYRNIPVPTSYMAYHSDFDFIGCYDHGKQAGMMHVANHHLVPGKKQWTWGNGDFGKAWDRQLTDEDGPYIELMCGAFTDNQPDFSWLQPGEEKRFTQVFMPYKKIGAAKNASREVVLNLESNGTQARIGVYVSRPRQIRVTLRHSGNLIFEKTADLSPEDVLHETIEIVAAPHTLTLQTSTLDGHELLRFTPPRPERPTVPAPASPAPSPGDVASTDELFLHGLHLEQYRHATYAPEAYYAEALRRDPGDSRCNNALGRLLLWRGKFTEAETHFRAAITRITMRNPNPYDGEPYFNLGIALRLQGRFDEAFDAFYKAVWNAAWQDSGYFELARIVCRRGAWSQAIDLLDAALSRNGAHHQARHLRLVCLRKLGRIDEAQVELDQALGRDSFNFGVLYEQALLSGNDTLFKQLMRNWAQNYIEIALDYAWAGLTAEALALLRIAPPEGPMAQYFAAWVSMLAGNMAEASASLAHAAAMAPDYCFPNHVEAVPTLQFAILANPTDAHAPYCLGNFWYAHRCYDDAIEAWEVACSRDPQFATPHRNLGLAYMNKRNDPDRSRALYKHAFALEPADARVFFEMDQLHKKVGVAPAARLADLEAHAELVALRDDLRLERITLLNIVGQHQAALDSLLNHVFHPWEGGEGKVAEQYVLSLLQLARDDIAGGRYAEAAAKLERAKAYPANLNEGKLAGTQDNHINYTLGLAHTQLGASAKAKACFEQAAVGLTDPASTLYYNDQPPDMIFYQGLAQQSLGNAAQAHVTFDKLVHYGEEHVNDQVQMDYFAVSLPNFLVFEDDLTLRHRIHCQYMMALGHLGLGQFNEAEIHFNAVRALEPAHIGTAAHARFLRGVDLK
jgi:tetratricopeptide (TPR) repeat protein